MNPHDFPAAAVTRVKASRPRDEELPVTMEPTLAERIAASWATPLMLVVACFGCAAVIAFSVRSLL